MESEKKWREIKQLFGACQCIILPHIYPDFWFNLFFFQTKHLMWKQNILKDRSQVEKEEFQFKLYYYT